MDLTNIPLPHVHDKGKVLTGEEKEQAAKEVTPLEKISHESKCLAGEGKQRLPAPL